MSQKSNLKKYVAVFVLSMISSSLYLLPYVKYVFYDALLVGLNATNAQLGELLSVYAIVCAIGYIPGGWRTGSRPRRLSLSPRWLPER